MLDLAPRLDTGPDGFVDTASVLANLELVITSDTALAHLAGGMGRPTWVVLPFAADWRWLVARGDSPWYPGMRLFRQPAPGAWGPVFEAVAAALRRVAAGEEPP
jgi:ADP-heptose:LPS heptosyltransferase